MVDLATRLRDAVGDKSAAVFSSALGLDTVGDLLAHLPRRYQELGELTDLAQLQVGDEVTVQAEVRKVERRQMRTTRRSFLVVTVTDGRNSLSLTFFNQPQLERILKPGTTAFFAGKVEVFNKQRQLTNPVVQPLNESDPRELAGTLIPIYPSTKKLESWKIARAVELVLGTLDEIDDPLPAALRTRYKLTGLREAYERIHRPAGWPDVGLARARLKWDEALVVQVALAQRRLASEKTTTVPRPQRPDGLRAAFDASLPFRLTDGQIDLGVTLAAELARPHPMHRLLMGEVGSGKTVVALRAMLTVVDAGGQAVLLAPTEVLASQHHRSLRTLLGPMARAGELDAADRSTRVVLVTGSMGARARREALAAIADGTAGLVVGTHALLQDTVTFADLALVVVDEQHRFGVEQRDVLRSRSDRPPHLLVMTATPIPRTLAMTVFGDLETSSLTELPSGRSPISSFVVPAGKPGWTDRMWGRVRDEVAAGRQAFVVCPRIGDYKPGEDGEAEDDDGRADQAPGSGGDERSPGAAVVDVVGALRAGELAGLRVEPLHGRMPADEKEAVMNRFAAGGIDVLVATTVVEVGVDVPNATVMVILDAERFGVSQLHQLRGRVGRGSAPGWCLLHTEVSAGSPMWQRLNNVASTSDGATLAQLDLEQRREGDVLGVAQSGGRRSLRVLELARDVDVITAAREEATAIVRQDPGLARHPALARALGSMIDEDSAAYLEKG